MMPQYARFIAIISQYMPDCGQELLSNLQNEFNELLTQSHNQDMSQCDLKVKNVRFQGEMAKFGLFFKNSPEKLLENFKFLLDNFHTQNIDITCHFLESCGRQLAATLEEEDRANFNSMLDLMWRLKEKDVISSIQLNHIEQTFAIC